MVESSRSWRFGPYQSMTIERLSPIGEPRPGHSLRVVENTGTPFEAAPVSSPADGLAAPPHRKPVSSRASLPSGYERRTQNYSPYAIDWRFLPENALLAKDLVRHYLVYFSNSAANSKFLSPVWRNTLGLGPANAVKSAKILFIHIPKTGGTSIAQVLYGKNLPHYTAQFWNFTYGDSVGKIPSFSMVRHPVNRLVSAYKMAVFGGTDIMAYSRFSRMKLRGLDSLESYVDYIFDNRTQIGRLPLELHDQASFILNEEGVVVVDKLFILNDQSGIPIELYQWLSIKSIPHLNATAPLSVSLNRKTRDKIEQIYSLDMQIYHALKKIGSVSSLKGLRF